MRALAIGVAALVGVCVAYVVVHLALIEIGQEIVILHRWDGEGSYDRVRLWIVDEGESTWLHHGEPTSPWVLRLESDPILRMERDGETRQYRASADPDAEAGVHRLLRAKYGFADRLVRFWGGTDREDGFATGQRCPAVPVRLEPI